MATDLLFCKELDQILAGRRTGPDALPLWSVIESAVGPIMVDHRLDRPGYCVTATVQGNKVKSRVHRQLFDALMDLCLRVMCIYDRQAEEQLTTAYDRMVETVERMRNAGTTAA